MADIVVADGQSGVNLEECSVVVLSAGDAAMTMRGAQDGEPGMAIQVIETSDYEDLENKPQINGVTLMGDLSSDDLGIIIPTNVSDLNNDAEYITSSSLPTNVSDLNNDAGYITSAALPTDLSDLNNDVGFITSAALPTDVSELNNDAGYLTAETDPVFSASDAYGITSSDISNWNGKSDFSGSYTDLTDKPTIPTKVSQLQNDSGFVNASGAASAAPVQSVNGSTGTVTISVPTKVSQLQNDSGFITDAGVTSFNGSTGAVTYSAPVSSVNGQTGAVSLTIPTVPTNVSSFNNDAGYLTLSTLPVYNGGVS